MSTAKDNITRAYRWALANRPKVNGFPVLAEALRQAGVTRYVYQLPSCQCIYFTNEGHVSGSMEAQSTGMNDVPKFNQDAFLKALRLSQSGESTFQMFLSDAWAAGVISYEADLIQRRVSYFGANGESYVEDYPAVEVTLPSVH